MTLEDKAAKKAIPVNDEQQQVEHAREIIRGMSEDEFGAFQRELQYAHAYHRAGQERVNQIQMAGDVPAVEWPRIMRLETLHREGIQAIITSPLYNEIRAQARQRWGAQVSNNWTGWIGLQENDPDTIRKAITDVIRSDNQYGVFGMIQNGDAIRQKADLARETLSKYKLTGTFIGHEKDLVGTFIAKYGEQPAAAVSTQ